MSDSRQTTIAQRFRGGLPWMAWTFALILGAGLMADAYPTIRRYHQQQAQTKTIAYKFEWPELLPYGTPFPDVTLEYKGSPIPVRRLLAGQWTYVFFMPRVETSAVEFPSLLAQRFQDANLRFLFIQRSIDPVLTLPDIDPARLLLASDKQGSLTARLKLPVTEYWTVALVDPEGIVRFTVPHRLPDNDLRQLTERTLLGHATERFTFSGRGYERDAAIPVATVRDVETGQPRQLADLATPERPLVFFRANCTSCTIASAISQVATLEREKRILVTPVFSRSYKSSGLSSLRTQYGLAGPVYVADSYIHDWEDPYITLAGKDTTSQLITVTANKKVLGVRDFQHYFVDATTPATPEQAQTPAAPTGRRLVRIDPGGPPIGFVKSMARAAGGELYLLDQRNHRIVVLSPEGKFTRAIGGIGQGDADLYQPTALTVSRDGEVYVVDQDGRRVQIFSASGAPVGRFPVARNAFSDTIAVTADGLVALNTPRLGDLVTVFTRAGQQVRSYGTLLRRRETLESQVDSVEGATALGRAHLLTAADGSTYAVFQFSPWVRKYAASGRLLWQTRLAGAATDHFAAAFRKYPAERPDSVVKSIDGGHFPLVVSSVSGTPDDGLLVMFANRHSCTVSANGIQGSCTEWRRGLTFMAITAAKEGTLFSAPGGLFRPAETP